VGGKGVAVGHGRGVRSHAPAAAGAAAEIAPQGKAGCSQAEAGGGATVEGARVRRRQRRRGACAPSRTAAEADARTTQLLHLLPSADTYGCASTLCIGSTAELHTENRTPAAAAAAAVRDSTSEVAQQQVS
jgi:hypothetical protein